MSLHWLQGMPFWASWLWLWLWGLVVAAGSIYTVPSRVWGEASYRLSLVCCSRGTTGERLPYLIM
jgi:hypothetical protein